LGGPFRPEATAFNPAIRFAQAGRLVIITRPERLNREACIFAKKLLQFMRLNV
jgi:hypothetical protein